MKPRSPVLGYNHNVRYAQMLWHVQTEDSGVQNPHIFTHLFHDGTILATKKLDYDATADVSTVQKLMQSQHKLMLRELKSGAFDAKIESRYGPLKREPQDAAEDTAPRERHDTIPVPLSDDAGGEPTPQDPFPAQAAAPQDEHATVPDLGAFVQPSSQPPTEARPRTITPVPPPPEEPARPRPRLTPSRPSIPVMGRSASNIPATPAAPPPTIGGRAAARSAPPTIGSGRSGAQAPRPPEGGVVVSRQTVIVGGDSKQQKETADFWATGATERKPQPDPSFGSDLISEKSLDEVILAYLSEDAPKK